MRPRLPAWRAAVGVLAFAAVALAPARAAPPEVSLEAMTSPELRARIAAGTTTVLIPIGGTEQNGAHLVLGKHNVRARLLAERIARELGSTVVAPVVAYVPEGAIDPPLAHMRYAGTISVPDKVFEAMLEAVAASLAHHGFRDVVLLGDHGGYQKGLRAVADRLNREWAATPVRVHAVPEYYRATEVEYGNELKRRGYGDKEIGTHAGLADTSLALAVDPRLVRMEQLHPGAPFASAEGVYGDPTRSSAELGQAGVDLIVARTVEAIRTATARR
jgi:creatinine amidohydrolase